MKKGMLGAVLVVGMAALLWGQGTIFSDASSGGNGWRKYETPYYVTNAPPVDLVEAYRMALQYVGVTTNRFYCISSTCLEPTKGGLPGWTFVFANTNAQRVPVRVSFDKEVSADTVGNRF